MSSSPGGVDFESRPLPKSFVLELTRRCNNHCLYCYTAWGAPELDYLRHCRSDSYIEEIKNIVVRLQDDTPVDKIALSGGEPLMREDLAEIVSFIQQRGIAVVIITNGTLLSMERVDAIGPEAAFEVSLLSYRREVHDRLAQNPGAWEAAVQGMANLRQRRAGFVAAFVATRQNYMDLRRTAELAIALGASALMYNRLNLGAFNRQYADELVPTPPMLRENLDVLEELAITYNLPVAVSVVLEPCVVDVRPYTHMYFGWCPRAGGDSYFTIDPAGNVRICNHSPVILGNLRRDRFVDIYYHHPHVRRFAETWPAECAECDPSLKAMCRGGCPAAAEQCYGTLERVDPFVDLSRKYASA